MKYLRILRTVSVWTSALILASLPMLLAIDFGGVLWWTQYLASVAIITAAILAAPNIFSSEHVGLLRQYSVVVILLLWCGYAWLQTVPIFGGLVAFLSNGSEVAYRDWLEPYLPEGANLGFFPISLAPEQSTHAVAVLTLVACAVCAASQAFVARTRLSMLLNVLAISAALHAAFGIIRQAFPEVTVLGLEMRLNSFGCFVNRNNAALFMNIGLAASLGLLAWRMAALTGMELDDQHVQFSDLFSLMHDRETIIGVVSASFCIVGLLICGSRGGIVATLMAMILAFGWIRERRGTKTISVVALAVLIGVAILLVPLNLDVKSIDRFELLSAGNTSSLLQNGRLAHWPAALRAAKAHFPAGSGLASYSYAYFPHQQTGADAWFHHADNLWLESIVEQGAIGLILTVAMLFLIVRTLLRMVHSVDPIDHGLRVAGWFIVGAVVISQCFDFGLIVPANLFAVAIFLAAILSRATATGLNVGRSERAVFPVKYATLYCLSLTGCVIFAAMLASSRLRADAEVDAVVRRVDVTLPTNDTDIEQLDELEAEILAAPRVQESPLLLDTLSKIEYSKARLIETAAANPRTAEEAVEIYQKTDVMERRKAWYDSLRHSGDADESGDQSLSSAPSSAPSSAEIGPAAQQYQSILDHSEQSLRRLPLGINARTWQLYLDFVHQDQDRLEQTIAQLSQIYMGNSRMLSRLGSHAAAAGDLQVATRLWRTSLENQPERAIDVLGQIQSQPGIELLDVLPRNETVYRAVARKLIDQKQASQELLELAKTQINCQSCESKKEKGDCLRLAGDIALELGDLDESFSIYREAIGETPTDRRLHLTYVRRLRQYDRRREARAAAKRAAFLFPDDKQFAKILQDMATEDLRAIEELDEDSILLQDAGER